jgi:hypothetical protein
MLSSILQQRGSVPDIVFSIGYPRNNGKPTTEEVLEFFKGKGLKFREFPYDGMKTIQFRGLVRNEQLVKATCDWILFSDCDMTYHPDFFANLAWQLKRRPSIRNDKRILSARRVSLDKTYCKNYFNSVDKRAYPCVVEDAGLLESWPVFEISRNCGAGYFQLVNRERTMKLANGLYVDPKLNWDRGWWRGHRMQGARSDMQFRSKMHGIRQIRTMPQYHLNHERDNEVKRHLEVQR